MPVVIGGWDSVESFQAAIARGEVPAIGPANYAGDVTDNYVVQPGLMLPYTGVGTSGTSGFGYPVVGGIPVATAGVMVNLSSSVLSGVWSGFDPGDVGGGLAILHSFAESIYGSSDLGVVRYSSEVLENEPTGIRPGTMERIVIPAWARRERGSPL